MQFLYYANEGNRWIAMFRAKGKEWLFKLGAFLLLGLSQFVNSEQLEIYTEEFPPYSYSVNSEIKGFVVELVEACMMDMGYTNKDHRPIRIIPWSRSYRYAKSDRPVMVFSMSRIPTREALFKWVGPVASYDMVFFGRSERQFNLQKLSDAKKITSIGVAKDTSASALLEGQGFTNLQYTSKAKLNLMKLANGRIDLWLGSNATIRFRMNKFNVKAEELSPVAHLYIGHLYLAFSQAVSDDTVNQWRQALQALKDSGKYQAIKSKYQHYFDLKKDVTPNILDPDLRTKITAQR